MKKEDFTTRLLKLFFHIQGPFDECRQEIIYRACARALIQIVYSSLLLFLFYLLFGLAFSSTIVVVSNSLTGVSG